MAWADRSYRVKWDTGVVTYAFGLSELLRILVANPTASTDVAILPERERRMVEAALHERAKRTGTTVDTASVDIRHMHNDVVEMTLSNGRTFITAHLSRDEARQIGAHLMHDPKRQAS